MAKRRIGKEIIRGLEEVRACKRGEIKLKTRVVSRRRPATRSTRARTA